MMSKVEDQIRRAMEEGQFDNLPGKGKPLRLDENPFEDPEWRLAHHVLRSSGFTLPWIEARRELEATILATRQALRRSWDWRQAALAGGQPPQLVDAEWKRAVKTFRRQVGEINRDILAYNLKAPSGRLHLLQIDVEGEIELTITPASDKL
jgi:DnaJ family protein C protein 28